MPTLDVGILKFIFPDGVQVREIEEEVKYLSYCMSCVDFVIEDRESVMFVEVKDPDNPNAKQKDRKRFIQSLETKGILSLVRKYRDTFLYCWSKEQYDYQKKHYIVLIACNRLERGFLSIICDSLKRNMPETTRAGFKRSIVDYCWVFNIESWNSTLGEKGYKVFREG